MADPSHHRLLERMYVAARCNAYYRPRISIGDGECEVWIPVRDDFHHAADGVHGSVYFKALDDAAFFAANSRVPGVFVLTSSFHIHFLAHVTDGEIRAVGRIVHEGKRQIVAESAAYDAEGKLVARGSGTFAITRIPLDEKRAARGEVR